MNLIGTIEDWYANRADGDMGSAPDDEQVEWTWSGEVPPELPRLSHDEVERLREDIDSARRLNGLAPMSFSGPSPISPGAGLALSGSPSPTTDIPYYVRERILALRRLYPSRSPKQLHVEMRRVGALGSLDEVRSVIYQANVERANQKTAGDRWGTAAPRHKAPAADLSTLCNACGLRIRERGLCNCS